MPSGWGHWLGRSGSRGRTKGVSWLCVTAARPVAPRFMLMAQADLDSLFILLWHSIVLCTLL